MSNKPGKGEENRTYMFCVYVVKLCGFFAMLIICISCCRNHERIICDTAGLRREITKMAFGCVTELKDRTIIASNILESIIVCDVERGLKEKEIKNLLMQWDGKIPLYRELWVRRNGRYEYVIVRLHEPSGMELYLVFQPPDRIDKLTDGHVLKTMLTRDPDKFLHDQLVSINSGQTNEVIVFRVSRGLPESAGATKGVPEGSLIKE